MTLVGVADIKGAFRLQAQFCDGLRAPFTAALCRAVANGIDPASLTGPSLTYQRLAAWPGEPMTDALPMRMTGALHWLVRAGRAPPLAALYPPAPMPDDAALAAALAAVVADPLCDAAIAEFLGSAPQTNEVGRAGALLPGLLAVAAATRLPLSLIELGASAGLNLNMDRFCADLGGVMVGDAASPVVVAPHWTGEAPPAVPLHIVARHAVDLAPLDVADAAVAERLLAFIWPDQPERLARTAAAIELARHWPPSLDAGDAADWIEQHLALTAGAATLVYHSIAFQYFPPTGQQRIIDRLEALGRTASPDAPLAWLRLEMDDPAQPATPAIRLRLWRGGPADERLLGHAHAHGAFVRWGS